MSESKFTKWLVILVLFLVPAAGLAQDQVNIPDELKSFVEKAKIPTAIETGDLNGDGRKDFILVISNVVPKDAPYEEGGGGRSVLVIIRESDGSLSLAARNDLAAMCKSCGGAFGDPFEGVVIRGTRFTVMNYGGSSDRWSYSYTFAYSQRDRTWQLVRVEESHFSAHDPDRTMKTTRYTPPKHFGLITFADFDPYKFKGKGKR